MERLRLPALYFLAATLAGALAESSGWLFLSVGLSLFIPSLFAISAKEEGVVIAIFSSLAALLALALLSPRSIPSIFSLQVAGAILLKLKERADLAVLLTAIILFGEAIFEEFLFEQLPLTSSNFAPYRFGIYFFAATLFAELVYGIYLLLIKEGNLFLKLKFGFWPVILFLSSGVGTLILSGALKVAAINLVVASLALFTAQGISVSLFFFKKLTGWWRLLFIVIVILFPSGFLLSSLILGFLDNWIDFRKFEGGGEDEGDIG